MAAVLNLGCGNRIVKRAINLDRTKHRPEVDVVHDLNETPWPFGANTFDLIIARAVLEHLRIDLVQSMDECWRVLKPGGRLVVKLPNWRSDSSYMDPTHYWQYAPGVLLIFDPTTKVGQAYGYYTKRKWKIVKGPRLNRGRSSFHATMIKVGT